ncbi:YggS family pyridoxal phosphate enzyme, partial [Frankia sp. AgKG'84/4]|nr:YggS family pyridoxal phosphate enzyme [Frankia sp. AgKG'84/4]
MTGRPPPAPARTGDAADDPRRRARLVDRLAAVRERIGAAARDAGRDPGDLTLIAVSKTYPAEDVVILRTLGVGHFAENRDQEAGPKVNLVTQRLGGAAAARDGAAGGVP